MQIGVATTVPSLRQAVEFAVLAEQLGFSAVGIVDTAPAKFQAVYPTVTAALQATDRIAIGTYTTNFVIHHWSSHACCARTFEELAPGRFFLGVATGDGAVHSLGLKPSSVASFETGIRKIREFLPGCAVPIMAAASGPKAIAAAGRVATDVILGVGLDGPSLADFAGRATRARAAAGVNEPLRLWAATRTYVANDAEEAAQARRAYTPVAVGNARYIFDPRTSYEGKNIRPEWEDDIRERLRNYRFAGHGDAAEGNPNLGLFDDRPEIRDYFVDRMITVGTREYCVARIGDAAGAAQLHGVMMAVFDTELSSQAEQLRRIADALRPLMTRAG